MMQCPIDGIKKELPDGFPDLDKIIGSLTNFVQGLLNSASAGGTLEPKKLVSAVGDMNIEELLSDVKKLSAVDCVVDEPYEPVAPAEESKENDSGKGKDKSWVSFGIRLGSNNSLIHAQIIGDTYNGYYRSGTNNGQFGFVMDFATSDWLHIQPGFMFVRKEMVYEYWRRGDDGSGSGNLKANYLEFPLLLSLKLLAFRFNVGPYLDLCLKARNSIYNENPDVGLSTGIGFDIGMFYIGAFYDYGFIDRSAVSSDSFYNRTLGFNLGVNL